MKNFRFLLLTLVFFTSMASAHKDRILTVQSDGSIPEIPVSFGPVSLKISGLGSVAPSVQFRSGAYINNIPGCVTSLIRSKLQSDVFVSGSWYHDESILPYYVSVKFHDPGYVKSKLYNSSTNILFNLHTAEIIEIKRFVARSDGNGGQFINVDLPKGCPLNLYKSSTGQSVFP
jgi:hypothetical protein